MLRRSGNRLCSYTWMLPWSRRHKKKILSVPVHNRSKRKRNLQHMNMEEKVRREQSTNWWEWNHNQIAGGETSSLLSSKEEFSHKKKMVMSQNWGTYHWPGSSKTLKMDWYCASSLMESIQIKWDICCYGRDQIST